MSETSVYELAREWKIIQTKLELDLLQAVGTDEERNRIANEAFKRARQIEKQMIATDPETVEDLAALLDVALRILKEGGTMDKRELAILKAVRRSIFSVMPKEVRYPKAA